MALGAHLGGFMDTAIADNLDHLVLAAGGVHHILDLEAVGVVASVQVLGVAASCRLVLVGEGLGAHKHKGLGTQPPQQTQVPPQVSEALVGEGLETRDLAW